jgi:transposase
VIGLNRYLNYKITHGSFIIKKFNLFVRQLLLKLNTFPKPRSVLILDNTKAHHSINLTLIYKEAGVRLKYLFIYSPDFNRIKEFFSILKA